MNGGDIISHKLLNDLEKIHKEFSEATFRIGQMDSDEAATKGDIYAVAESISAALLGLEVAFDDYFNRK